MAGIFPESGVPATSATNALTNPDVATGCAELWYSTARCNPRFDPAAQNALMSEILNLVNCGGTEYDCSRLDNLCIAIDAIIQDRLHGCLSAFPLANGCSNQQLVLTTDADGCSRLARYTADTAELGRANACSVVPVSTRLLPADPSDPGTFYYWSELGQDVINGTIDESRLTNNLLASVTVNVPCSGTTVAFEYGGTTLFDPLANSGNGAVGVVVCRIDGVFFLSNDLPFATGSWTNFERSMLGDARRVLSAGNHTVQWYVVGGTSARPPAQIFSDCRANGTSQSVGRVYIPAD